MNNVPRPAKGPERSSPQMDWLHGPFQIQSVESLQLDPSGRIVDFILRLLFAIGSSRHFILASW